MTRARSVPAPARDQGVQAVLARRARRASGRSCAEQADAAEAPFRVARLVQQVVEVGRLVGAVEPADADVDDAGHDRGPVVGAGPGRSAGSRPRFEASSRIDSGSATCREVASAEPQGPGAATRNAAGRSGLELVEPLRARASAPASRRRSRWPGAQWLAPAKPKTRRPAARAARTPGRLSSTTTQSRDRRAHPAGGVDEHVGGGLAVGHERRADQVGVEQAVEADGLQAEPELVRVAARRHAERDPEPPEGLGDPRHGAELGRVGLGDQRLDLGEVLGGTGRPQSRSISAIISRLGAAGEPADHLLERRAGGRGG